MRAGRPIQGAHPELKEHRRQTLTIFRQVLVQSISIDGRIPQSTIFVAFE